MKTVQEKRLSFSDDGHTVELRAPRSWAELQRGELGYILKLIARGKTAVELEVLMLLRFTGIHIEKKLDSVFRCYAYASGGRRRYFHLSPWQVKELVKAFDWVDSYDDYDVRLDSVCGHKAVDPLLHGVTFNHYLNLGKYYQGYLRMRSEELLDYMGQILYPKADGSIDAKMVLQPWERIHCMLWFGRVKAEFAQFFPNFLKPARVSGDASDVTEYDVMEQINVQLRALTDGDITKESAVMAMDCWRALTELDAKAREAAEIKRKMKK